MPGIVPGAWDLGGDVVNSSSLFSANVARSSSIVTDGYPPGGSSTVDGAVASVAGPMLEGG